MQKIRTMFIIGLITFVGMSCKDSTEKTINKSNLEQEPAFTFVSNTGDYKFELTNVNDSVIQLRDVKNNKMYDMYRVRSGSGARYEDKNGNVFWNKGNDFTFTKIGQPEVTGSLEN